MKKIVLFMLAGLIPHAHAELPQTSAHGFHWYSTSPSEKQVKEALPPPTLPVNVAPQKDAYAELMEVKRATLNKLSTALLTPSFEATLNYMKTQQVYAKHNQAFVRYWQQVLMTHPELDHTLNFPTDNTAIAVRNQSMNTLMERVVQEGAAHYGLIFFYRGEHSISQKMVGHLLPFVNASNFSMISVSTDGKTIEGLPNPKKIPLEAIQKTMDLQSRYMPALFLVDLKTQKMSPLSYGFVSTEALKERLLDVATNYKRFSYEGLSA